MRAKELQDWFPEARTSDQPVEKEGYLTLPLASQQWILLEEAGLSEREKQLVALTSVLAARPQILLLDEPTTLLDLRNRARLLKYLESLDQMLVLSTHDLDLAASCDEAVIIHDGRLLAQGDATQMVRQYRLWCAEGFPDEGIAKGTNTAGGTHER